MSTIRKTRGALLAGFVALACATPALAAPNPPIQQNQTTTDQYQAGQDNYQNQPTVAPQALQAQPTQALQPQPPQNASGYPANPANYQPEQNAYYPPAQHPAYPATSPGWQQSLAQPDNGMTYMRPVQAGSMTYITGGVGEDEQSTLQAEAGNYNLQITNSDKTGHFTADTNLTIQSGNGREMISAQKTGPLFYAKLPPGTYTIDATNGGQHRVQQIKVGTEKAKDVHLVWGDRNNQL